MLHRINLAPDSDTLDAADLANLIRLWLADCRARLPAATVDGYEDKIAYFLAGRVAGHNAAHACRFPLPWRTLASAGRAVALLLFVDQTPVECDLAFLRQFDDRLLGDAPPTSISQSHAGNVAAVRHAPDRLLIHPQQFGAVSSRQRFHISPCDTLVSSVRILHDTQPPVNPQFEPLNAKAQRRQDAEKDPLALPFAPLHLCAFALGSCRR